MATAATVFDDSFAAYIMGPGGGRGRELPVLENKPPAQRQKDAYMDEEGLSVEINVRKPDN